MASGHRARQVTTRPRVRSRFEQVEKASIPFMFFPPAASDSGNRGAPDTHSMVPLYCPLFDTLHGKPLMVQDLCVSRSNKLHAFMEKKTNRSRRASVPKESSGDSISSNSKVQLIGIAIPSDW
ncbi:hypothetical protein GF325_06775 [Candidatus Bathyarchaeota archaeon]|nr:hypothetical protein [Candidatus Bathyarchaeota archaeon]